MTSTQTDTPDLVKHHWIITTQTARGQLSTSTGSVSATPGVTTRTSTYEQVLEAMTQKHGTDQFVVLFFDLAPDQL
jgi:hypothetical protein